MQSGAVEDAVQGSKWIEYNVHEASDDQVALVMTVVEIEDRNEESTQKIVGTAAPELSTPSK